MLPSRRDSLKNVLHYSRVLDTFSVMLWSGLQKRLKSKTTRRQMNEEKADTCNNKLRKQQSEEKEELTKTENQQDRDVETEGLMNERGRDKFTQVRQRKQTRDR